MKWSNGSHSYYGKRNSRAQRGISKVIKGIHTNKKDIIKAFETIEYEGIKRSNIVREEE